MPAPLSADFRKRILAGAKTESASKTAARFDVSLSTVQRMRRLDRLEGSVEPKPHAGGHTHKLTDDDRTLVGGYLAENCSMPHAVIAARIEADTKRRVSPSTVTRALARWRLTRKKLGRQSGLA